MPIPRRTPKEELDQLRRFRNRPRPDVSITREVEALRKEVARRANAAGGMDTAWAELAPPGVRAVCAVVRLSPGGLLTVRAPDAAARFEADQWLRTGGLAALRGRCAATLRGVRFTLGPG
mgnify:CR=1 FL=1